PPPGPRVNQAPRRRDRPPSTPEGIAGAREKGTARRRTELPRRRGPPRTQRRIASQSAAVLGAPMRTLRTSHEPLASRCLFVVLPPRRIGSFLRRIGLDPSAARTLYRHGFFPPAHGVRKPCLVRFQLRGGERLPGTRPERLIAQTEVPEGRRPRNDAPHHACQPGAPRDGRAGSRRMPESRGEGPRPDFRGDGGGRVLAGLLRPLQPAVRAGLRPRDTLPGFRPEDPRVQRPPDSRGPPRSQGQGSP